MLPGRCRLSVSLAPLLLFALIAFGLLRPSSAWSCIPTFRLGDPALAPATGPTVGNTVPQDGIGVDLSTGLGVVQNTDVVLSDVIPITLTRTYRPNDTQSRAFGIGASHNYDLSLVGDNNNCTYADLVLPDGGRLRYTRIAGSNCQNAVLEHTASPTPFFKSVLVRDLNASAAEWLLKRTDGVVLRFSPRFTNYPLVPGMLLKSITDRNGNMVAVNWDPVNRYLVTITTPNGRWIKLFYDIQTRVSYTHDSTGRQVNYSYDGSGRLFRVTDPANGVTEYLYDSQHRLLTIRDARGNLVLTNQYYADGRMYVQTLPDGVYYFSYLTDGAGKVTNAFVYDPRVALRQMTFNAAGYITHDTRALYLAEQRTTAYERQAGTNLITAITDPLSRRTTYLYDALANVTEIKRLAHTPVPMKTIVTYTPFNFITYFPPSNLASITDPLSHTTTFFYDSKGNLAQVKDGLQKIVLTISYNSQGQPQFIWDGANNLTQFAYSGGDLISITDPEGNVTKRAVDSAGRLLRLTTPLGQTTLYGYDVLDRLTTVTDPLNGQTVLGYDANSNLLSLRDARLNTTSYTYDARNRVIRRTDPLNQAETYQYDGMNNLIQVTDRKGQITTYQYDGLNRRALATYADSSTTSYTYDRADRLTQVNDSTDGPLMCGYDDLDRLDTEGTPRGTVNYDYDLAGRRTTLSATGQPPISYTHDNADRLTSVLLNGALAQFAYDTADRRTLLQLPHGVRVEYAYDKASRIIGLTYKLGTATLGNLSYTYDRNSQRVQVGGSFARTNLPAPVASATYDANNRVVTFDGFPVSHDQNGNLTSLDGDTFTWNVRDQLVGIVGTGLSTSFGYDGFGRRSKKTVNGQSTEYLSDGINPLQE
ncbi:MAG: DUF6531 domain-containing protein, partial [Candidatus Binatia bacterium]